MSGEHWTATAERTTDDWDVLGGDDRGDLWVPSCSVCGWWDRRFSPWRPTHWPAWLRSRRRRRLAFIETQGWVDPQ